MPRRARRHPSRPKRPTTVQYDRKGWALIERHLLAAHCELRLAAELFRTLQRRK